MILRIFRVEVREGRLDAWRDQVVKHSIPWMRGQPGCVAFWPGEPVSPGSREFSMTSLWDDLESIKRSIGEDWKEAVLFGREADLAESVSVDHYSVFGVEGSRP